jgi:glycosyltransferase involved in cell wall biosynthesis
MSRRRIAVVSPFIDKRHGTERRVAECVNRLADDYEIHIYSNRVEDVDLGRVTWHRIPALPGPHLFAYLWWVAANHLWRWRDRRFRGLKPAVVYSPGINCFDADATSVHIVFARFRDCVKDELHLTRNPLVSWPQLIHRRLYYRLIETLEHMIYTRRDLALAVVSNKVGADLGYYYGRTQGISVVYGGLDPARFSPERRAQLRESARQKLSLSDNDFALLLIGNDWKNKGLLCLLQAAGRASNQRIKVLVAGRDNPAPFEEVIEKEGLKGRVFFLPPRADVEFFYAAADAYVGPSLEDAFAQPPAEAMASGLPVITSKNNGGAEIIRHGETGFIMENPTDADKLAEMIRTLISDPALCSSIGDAAAETARGLTWEENARQMGDLFERSCRSNGDGAK